MNFRFPVLIFSFFLLCQHLSAQEFSIGSWRDELPYREAISVTQSADKIYCATPVSLFSITKSDNSLEKISKVNGLSDIGFNKILFDTKREQLIIAYSNSNIDLLKATGTYNISDIKRKNIVGDKNIYSIYISGNIAYLSCGFGVVTLDLDKREITDTYYPGQTVSNNRINSFSSDSFFFYAASASGLYRASVLSTNLADFSQWNLISGSDGLPTGEVKEVFNFNHTLFCNVKDTLFAFNGSSWNNIFFRKDYRINSMNNGSDAMLVCIQSDSANHPARVMKIFSNGTLDSLQIIVNQPKNILTDESENYWLADASLGLNKINGTQLTPLFPSGPLTKNASDIVAHNHLCYVAPGSAALFNYHYNSEGVFVGYGEGWVNFNRAAYGSPFDTLNDFFRSYYNPYTGDVYFSSFGWGLLRFTADNKFIVYGLSNSALEAPAGDALRPRVTGTVADDEGNLWVTTFDAANRVAVMTADGTWKSFHATSATGIGTFDITIDQNHFKWMVLPTAGILVYDSGEDPLATNDDQWKTLTMGIGKGALPNNNVQCLAVDKDGYVWVGTEEGVAVFYCPYDVFSANGCDAQQIIVKQDLYNGYLLGTESINDMAVDGANRKWFATNSGVYLMSADGLTQLQHFTKDNSPLFSDIVNCIGIDDVTGDVFMGTELGIIVYRGDAVEGTGDGSLSDTAFIFPNPVRENFTGVVSIQKLSYQSEVKITDLSGALVYETPSNGGEAVWNLKDLNGNRVNTGVYLVYATNSAANDKLVGKIAVIK